jgi:hypothetical protein
MEMDGKKIPTALILLGLVFIVGCKGSSVRVKEVESKQEFDEFEREYIRKAYLPKFNNIGPASQPGEPTSDSVIFLIDRIRSFPSLTFVLSPGGSNHVMVGESIRWCHLLCRISDEVILGKESANSPGDVGSSISLKYVGIENNKLTLAIHFAANTMDPDYHYIRWLPTAGQKSDKTCEIPAAIMLFEKKMQIAAQFNHWSEHTLGSYKTPDGEVVYSGFRIIAFPYSKEKMKEITEGLEKEVDNESARSS